MEAGSVVEETCPNTVLNLRDRIAKLLGDGLTLERIDGVRLSRGRMNEERDDGGIRSCLLQAEVEAREGFDEHVDALIPVLVTSSREHVQRVVEVEVEMTREEIEAEKRGGNARVR